MSSKCNSQNQTGQAITDKHDELINELKSYLYDMCKDNLEKGKPRRKTRDTWSRILNDYLNVPYGDSDRTFQQEANKIKMQFDDIAKLFMYNRAQERPCDPREKWVTWQDIEGKIQRIPGGYPIDERIIAELDDLYRGHYREQRICFNRLFNGKKIDDTDFTKFREDEKIETQVEAIKNADMPRNNNEFDLNTKNWVVVIDETGNFGKSKKEKDRKIVAVHIPLNNNPHAAQMKTFCSRASCCQYSNCPGDCLKNWHAVNEKYQEIDRVVRLISSKEKGKESGCVVIGITPNDDSELSWSSCVKKLISISAKLLTDICGTVNLEYRVEQYCQIKPKTQKGKRFINEIHQRVPYPIILIGKDDELDPLADAAAFSWRKNTNSIVKRTHWKEKGLYAEKRVDELLSAFQSKEQSVYKIQTAFEIDALYLGIEDSAHTTDSGEQATYFLQPELLSFTKDIALTDDLNQFKQNHIQDIIFSITCGSASPYVLEHESDWNRRIGDI